MLHQSIHPYTSLHSDVRRRFQLVLSDSLRAHLGGVADQNCEDQCADGQPFVFDAGKPRMAGIPAYSQSAAADNVRIFHGREVRKVSNAAGGMGFVLYLSLAMNSTDEQQQSNSHQRDTTLDPEGWTSSEVAGYDGWGHDGGRTWRHGERLDREGFSSHESTGVSNALQPKAGAFSRKFGPEAYALHHRFYLHLDRANRLWLAAEDGCEGTPAAKSSIRTR